MKYLPSQLVFFLHDRTTKRNVALLLRLILFLAVLMMVYSFLFHIIMLWEGRTYSWFTGVYWTLTVMSTLGFGDITFLSDLGLVFSSIVLLSGIVLLLIMLPFTFIQFFYAPWLSAQEHARAPRELPRDTKGHVVLTNFDPIVENLIKKLELHKFKYVILVNELQRALEISDLGYSVMFGDFGDPETYQRLQIHHAALAVIINDDMTNTDISFTIRGISSKVPIVTHADHEHSVDVLEFAGNTNVFQFMDMLGQSLGRRVIGGTKGTNVVWRYKELVIAEASVMGTVLEDAILSNTMLREKSGLTVVGVWERGKSVAFTPSLKIKSSMILMLAGSTAQLAKYEENFGSHSSKQAEDERVLILGGGRVGRAAALSLEKQDICYRIVEKSSSVVKLCKHVVKGSAADIDTLRKAGINNARTVIITTHNDAINIYLTIYCRQLRPDIQIIVRATNENTVTKLYRGGADLVMSYASLCANTVMNFLEPEEVLMAIEGVSVFRIQTHAAFYGKSLTDTRIRKDTGCSVVAIVTLDGMILSPDPNTKLQKYNELILIGTAEAEKIFMEKYKC